MDKQHAEEAFHSMFAAMQQLYEFNDELGSAIVEFSREIDDTLLFISFNSQVIYEVSEEDALEDDYDEYDVPFKVVVVKNGNAMIYNCGTAREGLFIENVQYLPDGGFQEDKELYSGPLFEDLDDNLKDGFYKQLYDQLGINDDLVRFVRAYADNKHEREYQNWRESIYNFVTN